MSVGEDVQQLLKVAAVTGNFGSEWERQVVETSYTGSTTQLMRTAALVRTMSLSEEKINAVVCQLDSSNRKKKDNVISNEKLEGENDKENGIEEMDGMQQPEVKLPQIKYELKRRRSLVSLRKLFERSNSKSGLPVIQNQSEGKLLKNRRPTRIISDPLMSTATNRYNNINRDNNSNQQASPNNNNNIIIHEKFRRRANSFQSDHLFNKRIEEREQLIKKMNLNKFKKTVERKFLYNFI